MAFSNTLTTSYLSPISVSRSSLIRGPVLDEFGENALFGYSLKKLKDDADKCIRVVRGDGDNIEKDIGFTSDGIIDMNDIDSFAQGFPCYVKLWYNQLIPGGTFHLGSTVEAQQPLISGGKNNIWQDMGDLWAASEDSYGYIYIDHFNNLPYLYFRDTAYLEFIETSGDYTDSIGWSTESINLNNDYSLFFLGQSHKEQGTTNIFLGNSGSSRVNLSNLGSVYSVDGTGATMSFYEGLQKLYLWEAQRDNSNNLSLYRNNINLTTSPTTSTGIFTIDKIGEFLEGDVFEILGFDAISTVKSDLLDYLDDYYNIRNYGISPTKLANTFASRVVADGGTLDNLNCLIADLIELA